MTKVFNACKFAMMNGAKIGELPTELTDADQWILARLDQTVSDVNDASDSYNLSKACETLYHFTWDEFCDWYLELAKVQLGAQHAERPEESAQGSESTQIVLGTVLDTLLRLLHPFIPFVTEDLWTALTGGETLVTSEWPAATGYQAADATKRIEDFQKLVTEIRRFRGDQGLKDSQKVAARIAGLGTEKTPPPIAALARLTDAPDTFSATASLEIRLSDSTVTVEIDTSGSIDLVAERKRLEKDLAVAQKDLAQSSAKLGNPEFLGKAPDHVVAKIKERAQIATEEVSRITERLEGLK